MANNFSKNIIFCVLIIALFFFFLNYKNISAQPFSGSGTVGISATVPELITVTPTGGSTSGSISLPKTAVGFFGYAYPNAIVTLLKGGQVNTTVTANANGAFSITLEELYSSNTIYSLFAEDLDGNRSLLLNYPMVVQTGYFTQLNGIRFAPTIVTDKLEVRNGDYLTVYGYALGDKELDVTITGGGTETIFTLTSQPDGTYKIVLPVSGLKKGEYSVFINYKNDTRISKLIKFAIGDKNVFFTEDLSSIPGDCNVDKIINLVDFSILAYWYGKDNPPSCVDTNKDGVINLTDFSILAFYWTG